MVGFRGVDEGGIKQRCFMLISASLCRRLHSERFSCFCLCFVNRDLVKVKVKYASWVAQKSNAKMKSIKCEKRKHRRSHRGVVLN